MLLLACRIKATILGWLAVRDLEMVRLSGLGRAQEAIELWHMSHGSDQLKWQEMGCIHFALAVHGHTGNTNKAREYLQKAADLSFSGNADLLERLKFLPALDTPATLTTLRLKFPFPNTNRLCLGPLRYEERIQRR